MRTLAEKWKRWAGLEITWEGVVDGPVVMEVAIEIPRAWGARWAGGVTVEDRVTREKQRIIYTTSAA